jgi:hypothetical protein
MKIQTISVVPMSLVSALAFMSQATAACDPPPCAESERCYNHAFCVPIAAPAPPTNTLGSNICTYWEGNLHCKVESYITIPFEAPKGAAPATTK